MPPEVKELISKLLNSGKSEQEVVDILVQNKIEPGIAAQAVAEVANSGQGIQMAGKPQGGAGTGSQGLRILRSLVEKVGAEMVLTLIGAVLDLEGSELNTLKSELIQSIKQTKGAQQNAENGYPNQRLDQGGQPMPQAQNPMANEN